jgi:hypothetical protein
MNLKEWINKQVTCGPDECWAVYKVIPERFILRDTAFGPMRNNIPTDVQIDQTETNLKLENFTAIREWLK